MTGMHALWLPIVLSAVAAFIVSSVIHMMSPWHKGDYATVPDQDAVMDALRPFAIPPNDYMLPRAGGMAEMKSPAFLEKMNKGPVIIMTVRPNGMWGMGGALTKWFLYLLIVDAFAAYIAGRALPPGAEFLPVFRFVATAAFLGCSAALWQMNIWYHRKLSTTITSSIDGLIYALIAGAIFGHFWPR